MNISIYLILAEAINIVGLYQSILEDLSPASIQTRYTRIGNNLEYLLFQSYQEIFQGFTAI